MFSNPDKLKGNMINCGAYSQKQTCSNLIKLQMLYFFVLLVLAHFMLDKHLFFYLFHI